MDETDKKLLAEVQKEMSAEFFCEICGHYPLVPVHGHFECPACRYKTKCCEGAPLE